MIKTLNHYVDKGDFVPNASIPEGLGYEYNQCIDYYTARLKKLTKAKKTALNLSKTQSCRDLLSKLRKAEKNADTKLQEKIDKLLVKTATPSFVEATPEIDALEVEEKKLQEEIAKTEALQAQLDEQIKQAEIKRQQRELSKEEQEEEITALKEQVKATKKIAKLHTKLQAYQEIIAKERQLQRNKLNLDRVFTSHQRDKLFLRAGGKCQLCGDRVSSKHFEADHIIPYSKGGPTTFENGQCLCRTCNRRKGNR